jgi:hypothetical protein
MHSTMRDGRKTGTGTAALSAKVGYANAPRRGVACPRFAQELPPADGILVNRTCVYVAYRIHLTWGE